MLGLKVVLLVIALICLAAGILRRDASPSWYTWGAALFMWLVIAMMIWPN